MDQISFPLSLLSLEVTEVCSSLELRCPDPVLSGNVSIALQKGVGWSWLVMGLWKGSLQPWHCENPVPSRLFLVSAFVLGLLSGSQPPLPDLNLCSSLSCFSVFIVSLCLLAFTEWDLGEEKIEVHVCSAYLNRTSCFTFIIYLCVNVYV